MARLTNDGIVAYFARVQENSIKSDMTLTKLKEKIVEVKGYVNQIKAAHEKLVHTELDVTNQSSSFSIFSCPGGSLFKPVTDHHACDVLRQEIRDLKFVIYKGQQTLDLLLLQKATFKVECMRKDLSLKWDDFSAQSGMSSI